jgi:hypothetical protein
MVLEVSTNWLIEKIGHDGSEVWWPGLPEPTCRRGFHIQEIIDIAFACGFTVTPFEARPVSRGGTDIILPFRYPASYRILSIASGQPGVATGVNAAGIPHAIAWDGSRVLDCAGRITRLEDFGLQVFWAVCPKAKQDG